MNDDHQFLDLHGQKTAVRLIGDGPVLLLVHGLAGSAATWQHVTEQLSEQFTVVVPDLPGHGRSEKPPADYSLGTYANFLRDLLVKLDIPEASIVGHSLGGGIAMQFAYQYPDFCECLILVSSGGLGVEVAGILRALSAPGAEIVLPVVGLPVVQRTVDEAMALFSRFGIKPSRQAAEIWRGYASLTEPSARSAFIDTIRSVIDLEGQRVSALSHLDSAAALPTLIIWGEDDPIIPVEHGRNAHRLIEGSRLEIFEGVGHFPANEQPKRFADLLVDFRAPG